MKVVEIFKSIDGEGIRAGYPATFIRLFGCNLRCSYCDTPYGYEGNDYKEMTVDEIVQECMCLNCPRITLTGGEPLIHKDVNILIKNLLVNGFEVNIETNGSVDVELLKFLFIEQYNTQGVTVTVAPFPIPPEPQGSFLCGLRC